MTRQPPASQRPRPPPAPPQMHEQPQAKATATSSGPPTEPLSLSGGSATPELGNWRVQQRRSDSGVQGVVAKKRSASHSRRRSPWFFDPHSKALGWRHHHFLLDDSHKVKLIGRRWENRRRYPDLVKILCEVPASSGFSPTVGYESHSPNARAEISPELRSRICQRQCRPQ